MHNVGCRICGHQIQNQEVGTVCALWMMHTVNAHWESLVEMHDNPDKMMDAYNLAIRMGWIT